jgi:hypothetical protein
MPIVLNILRTIPCRVETDQDEISRSACLHDITTGPQAPGARDACTPADAPAAGLDALEGLTRCPGLPTGRVTGAALPHRRLSALRLPPCGEAQDGAVVGVDHRDVEPGAFLEQLDIAVARDNEKGRVAPWTIGLIWRIGAIRYVRGNSRRRDHNLKTAKALGLAVSPTQQSKLLAVLQRPRDIADAVDEDLHHRTDSSILQRDDRDWPATMGKIDRQYAEGVLLG